MKLFLFFLLKLLLIPFMLVVCYSIYQSISNKGLSLNSGNEYWFISIFGGAILFRLAISFFYKHLKKNNPFYFIDTLEHELTHAFFGYLTFSPPESLKASHNNEGEVVLSRRNVLIALSPYFFPLWTSLSLLIGFFIKEEWLIFWHSLTLCLLGFFVYRVALEIRWYQSDLKIYGRFFSLLFITLGLVFTLTSTLHFTGMASGTWISALPGELLHSLQNIFQGVLNYTFK